MKKFYFKLTTDKNFNGSGPHYVLFLNDETSCEWKCFDSELMPELNESDRMVALGRAVAVLQHNQLPLVSNDCKLTIDPSFSGLPYSYEIKIDYSK